jgi:hypothetical protein
VKNFRRPKLEALGKPRLSGFNDSIGRARSIYYRDAGSDGTAAVYTLYYAAVRKFVEVNGWYQKNLGTDPVSRLLSVKITAH